MSATVDRINVDVVETKLSDDSTVYAVRVFNWDNDESVTIDMRDEISAINLANVIQNNLEGN